ncbi:DNA-binding protein [Pantoea sp. Cy-639]|uniref:DNA-binding protein n=1 Tax=Pantoea sp. Cy-639 TaxID=2608360 RepID=UPI0014248C90|nr:DNA-binding protein [Pantoea sp. Cy-639]NIF18146.1 cointegrate resolution protein T [Pantoea sp. Cy-639]
MSRGGIDRAAVQQARQMLMARGLYPSIDAVRIELGNTGSKTTIHRYLKELDRQPLSQQGTASLSEPLERLVEQLANQLREEGQARIDEAEAAFERQREQLQEQLQRTRQSLEMAQRHSERQADALQVETDKLVATQAALHAEQLRSASLSQALGELQVRLADKDEQIRSLEDKHRDARATLEQDRVSQRDQREQEQRRHEVQVRQLQGQLQTLQLGMGARQEELTRLHRDNERLQVEQRQAQALRTQLEQQLEQRDAQVQGLRAILAQAQGASEEMRRQLQAQRERRDPV